ncbi:riboflavin kinase [Nocardioides speluncae]|uniref:riboflavin kinase n=1 Tax=Nocardioides speluncae TaxID=2670337 RepID=UPI000D69638C
MHDACDRPVVEAVVEVGDQRGCTLGFPTANISVPHDALGRDGVWAGLVHLLDEPGRRPLIAAVSVGRRPTFNDKNGPRFLEAHLIGFQGDLYGRPVKVELCERLRPMRAFDGDDGSSASLQPTSSAPRSGRSTRTS